ncbi:MAG TPA: GntR family transcriptional regulator [Gammaproteobacteria bacterium]|nr:GntR family transcriptional regulator [Gammaproteobacteria bacterium]
MFILKPHSGLPIYRQLLEQIRRMVASGQLAPGTELPSIRDLAVRHAINPMTVSKVYSLLESEGVLERNRGKPMTVAARRAGKAPLAARLEALEPHLENLILAARQLELDSHELVDALRSKWEKKDD